MKVKTREFALFFTLIFVLFSLRLPYLYFVHGGKIRAYPGNSREVKKRLKIERGKILDRNGEILADSTLKGEIFKRTYPQGKIFSHAVGYFSPRYGEAGSEAAFENYLSGYAFSPSPSQGADVYLTLDKELQKKAYKYLQGKRGAIICLNPKNGEVLVLVSSPSFDPNEIENKWEKIINAPQKPLFNRATQGTYPPGSSLKILTLVSCLEENLTQLEESFKAPSRLKVSGGYVTNFGEKNYGSLSLKDAFTYSVNTVFAQLGLRLGERKIKFWAEKVGFNKKFPFELPTKNSTFPEPKDKLDLAWSAVGQGRVLATPLEMAYLISAIANKGAAPEPHILKEVITKEGKVIYSFTPKYKKIFSSRVTEKTRFCMEEVVKKGTGRRAFLRGVQVAGKTGTAELSKGKPHSWFVAFAPSQNPQIVVVVLIENGGEGGKTAAPIAKELIHFYLQKASVKY
jgi:peptidoglycan glycosyltransferase